MSEIKCQNVSYKISNQNIITDINFEVKNKDNLLILGPSGSGKSTLLAILCGLQKPDSGEVLYNNKNLYKLDNIDNFRRDNFGIIFQNFHLIKSLNVNQNLGLAFKFCGKKIDQERIFEVLERLNLAEKSQEKITNLSGGEIQRLAIARAIIHKPKWIFCDEATSFLDDINTQKTLELLNQEAKNCDASLIFVTHDNRVKKFFTKNQILQLR